MTKLLNIKNDEKKPLLILFGMFFSVVSTSISGSAVRDTFFLINFNKSYLPIMYILIAISMVWVISTYKKMTFNRDPISIITISNFIFSIPLIFFKLNLYGIFIPILYIWIEIITILSILQFWIIAGEIFNPRQAKRLFTIIGAGGSISGIGVGFSIKPFVYLFGPDNLLLVTLFFIGLTVYLSQLLRPFFKKSNDKTENFNKEQTNFLSNSNPYIKGIAIMVGLSAFISKVIDYQFKIVASNTFPNQEQLISFFGSFYIITGVATLIMQFFITNLILRRLGILLGLMILPTMLFLGSTSFLMIGTITTIYFAKFSDQVFKFSINNSIQEILWLPTKNKIKKSIKPIIDGTIRSSIEGLAGLLIFILTFYSFIPESKVQIFSIPIILGSCYWFLNNFKLKNGYVNSLIQSIENRNLSIDNIKFDINDSQIIKTIDKTLNSKDELKQLFVIDLLWKHPLKPWINTIEKLFISKNYKIRRAILELTWNQHQILTNKKLKEIIEFDEELRPFAIDCLGDRKINTIVDLLDPYLYSNSIVLQCAASCSIIKQSPNHKKSISIINRILKNNNNENILTLMGFLKNPGHLITDNQYSIFLEQGSNELKIQCLKILKRNTREALINSIINSLSNNAIHNYTEITLLNYPKTTIIEKFNHYLTDLNINNNLKEGILRTIHNYNSKKALHLSLMILDNDDIKLVNEASNALIKISRIYLIDDKTLKQIDNKIFYFAEKAYELHQLKNKIENNSKAILINDHIENDLNYIIQILLKLGTLKDPDIPIETYIRYIKSKNLELLPLVIELIDSTFTNKNKQVTLPLIDSDFNISDSIKTLFPNIDNSIDYFLIKWIKSNDQWKKIISIQYLLKKEDSTVLSKINWEKIPSNLFLEDLFTNSEKNYINRNFLKNKFPEKDNNNMYSVLEKTIFLKSIDLFSQIPGNILTKIGQISHEITFEKNSEIFKKGDHGDSLFVIIKGKINILQNHNSIAILKKGSCIGEMAILDHEPRSADAVALTESILLKIDQNTFYELMATSPDIMKQIIKILTKRLRKINQKIINDQK